MDPAAIPPTPPQSATSPPPESCISSAAPPFQLLEISLISAQDLPPISKSMQTHAVAWVTQTRKHTTRTDHKGHKNPTWNDKFIFPLPNDSSEKPTLTVEIYTASWFRDVLVGTVKVPVTELVNPLTRARNTRFVALQVRRPSGNPQGNLNIGVALLETTMRSMPLSLFPPPGNNKNIQKIIKNEKQVENDEDADYSKELHAKIHQWRSLSTGSSVLTNNNEDNNFPTLKQGSMCNGSEICSDIGPSASIVAVELAKNHHQQQPLGHDIGETGSSIVEELTVEEAKAKGYARVERWRKCDDVDHESSELMLCDDNNNGRRRGRNSRRSSDGGLFSCLVYGIEFTIVCGTGNNVHGNKSNSNCNSKKKNTKSEASTA